MLRYLTTKGCIQAMRAVVTRVSSASVTIGGAVEGTIDRGFLILLGVGPSDTPAVCDKLA